VDQTVSTAVRSRGPIEAMMTTTQTTAIEPGHWIRLPAEWAEALGLQDQVILVRTDEGILIRPRSKATWDDIFADKLRPRPGDPGTAPEVTEVSGDDLLF
jgi:hypothetical protein